MNPKDDYFNHFRKLLFTTLEQKDLTKEDNIFSKVEHSSTIATETYITLKTNGHHNHVDAYDKALKVLFCGYNIK